MKKLFLLIALLAGLIAAHKGLLEYSEEIAMQFAPRYTEPSTAEVIRQLHEEHPSDGWLHDNRPATANLVALRKHRDYRIFVHKYADPIQEKIDFGVNAGFIGAYLLLAFVAVKMALAWLRNHGAASMRRVSRVSGQVSGELLNTTGLKGAMARRNLRQADEEFARIKRLFDNGLMSEREFELKKARIKDSLSER